MLYHNVCPKTPTSCYCRKTSRKAVRMPYVFLILPSAWKTWTVFPAPAFGTNSIPAVIGMWLVWPTCRNFVSFWYSNKLTEERKKTWIIRYWLIKLIMASESKTLKLKVFNNYSYLCIYKKPVLGFPTHIKIHRYEFSDVMELADCLPRFSSIMSLFLVTPNHVCAFWTVAIACCVETMDTKKTTVQVEYRYINFCFF